MRIYKNDIIKASAISTGADRGVLLCSITDSGFTSIAGVISAVKETCCGIILPLFTQGQKSHEFPNGLRVGNKE